MIELGNMEMTTDSIAEIKTLVTDIKENMMNEKNCNDQLYTIIQTLDGIGTYLERLEQGETPKTEEYTVLQTNILEVRNELAKLNQNVDDTILSQLQPLIAKLTEKVNRLDIIANNSGIDKQVLMNVSAQLEQNMATKLNENAEVLYNQSNTATNLIKTDLETLNANLKDGVAHLEKVVQTAATSGEAGSIKSLSDDITLLSSNLEKSNDNLKRSLIDLFSKIQENIVTTGAANTGANNVNTDALHENIEMLKNGLYNINLNSTQQYNKMLQVLSEIEAYSKLEEFVQTSSLPAIGSLKTELYTKFAAIINNCAATVDMSEPNTAVEQLTENIYNEFVSILGNATANLQKEKAQEEIAVSEKIDELIPYTKESVKDIKDLICELKRNLSYLQSGEENSDYTYSMQDIESDVAKIRIYLNELGQHINTIIQNNPNNEINNIYLMMDAINQKVQKNESYDITENIKKIQEDVLSISTRVNKMMLSSDKDSETLKDSLDEFINCFNQINSEIKADTHMERYGNIELSLNRIDNTLQDNKSYNELINQSLVMLAEWVDNAGESLTNISERLGGGIESIEIPQTIDYTAQIEALEQKIAEQNTQIAQQQSYITAMDEKLAQILSQNQQIALQEEKLKQMDERLTTILEFSAKNDASAVMNKMANIDSQLEKLNHSIGKLTSYVDEE